MEIGRLRFLHKERKNAKVANAVAGGVLGALAGSVFGPGGATIGGAIGAKLGHKQIQTKIAANIGVERTTGYVAPFPETSLATAAHAGR